MKFIERSRAYLALAAIAGLTACAGKPQIGGDPTLEVQSLANLPTPKVSDYKKAPGLYSVGPYDKLAIDVWGIPELSVKSIMVDVNGYISFPLAGAVQVAGLNPAQIEQELATRLKESYVRNPRVTVNVVELVSNTITVDGQVRRPGAYPVPNGMTLMQSVALAEGVTNEARLNDVVVFRTVGGQRYAALYNLGAIRRGQYPDPEIYANDIVMVGDAASRRLFKDLLTAVPALLTPIVILLTQN